MTDGRSLEAAGDDRRDELDWLADRFLLGELAADEEQAVVDRLAADEALAAAVARSSRLIATLRTTPAASVQPARPRGPRSRIAVAVAAVAAAVALVAFWPMLAPRPGPAATDGGPREVVRLWRQSDEPTWVDEETLAEEEPVDGDAVPDWMLAAVGLDAPSSLESGVQEN